MVRFIPRQCSKALVQPVSDHCPLLLETGTEDWGPPPFRFELMWLYEKDFSKCVEEWWTGKKVGTGKFSVVFKKGRMLYC